MGSLTEILKQLILGPISQKQKPKPSEQHLFKVPSKLQPARTLPPTPSTPCRGRSGAGGPD